MLKSSTDVLWSVLDLWSYMGEAAYRYSLNLFPKVLADSPMYSSFHSNLLHLYLYITPVFCLILSISFDVTMIFFNILPLFEMCLYATFSSYVLDAFTYSLGV